MPSVRPIAVLASLGLAACAATRSPDVRLPAAFEAVHAPAATAAPAPAPALDRWWTAFGDPQLTALVEQALAANPDARSAAARLREARASRASVLAEFLPQGDLTGSARRTHNHQISGTLVDIPGFSTSGTSERYSANFDVSWEVDLLGRFFPGVPLPHFDFGIDRQYWEANLDLTYDFGHTSILVPYVGVGANYAHAHAKLRGPFPENGESEDDFGANVLAGVRIGRYVFVQAKKEAGGGDLFVLTAGLRF